MTAGRAPGVQPGPPRGPRPSDGAVRRGMHAKRREAAGGGGPLTRETILALIGRHVRGRLYAMFDAAGARAGENRLPANLFGDSQGGRYLGSGGRLAMRSRAQRCCGHGELEEKHGVPRGAIPTCGLQRQPC